MDQWDEIERIVECYSTTLLRVAMHQVSDRGEAEDILQNVFLKYIQKKPVFHDADHEKAWLMRVTINMAHDTLKHWWKRKRNDLPNEIEKNEVNSSFELLPYLRKLPKNHCLAIYLYYYEGYSTQEIAHFYQTKETTVSSWLFRGRKELKKMIGRSVMNEEFQL